MEDEDDKAPKKGKKKASKGDKPGTALNNNDPMSKVNYNGFEVPLSRVDLPPIDKPVKSDNDNDKEPPKEKKEKKTKPEEEANVQTSS